MMHMLWLEAPALPEVDKAECAWPKV